MALCASGLLISAVVLIVILNDIVSNRIDYIPEHFFLGSITCVLFFTLCNYGLEQVNWAFLVLIPVIFFIKWLYTPPTSTSSSNYHECDMCDMPENSCAPPIKTNECKPPPNPPRKPDRFSSISSEDSNPSPRIEKVKISSSPLTCPGNPVVLPTACGITRFN